MSRVSGSDSYGQSGLLDDGTASKNEHKLHSSKMRSQLLMYVVIPHNIHMNSCPPLVLFCVTQQKKRFCLSNTGRKLFGLYSAPAHASLARFGYCDNFGLDLYGYSISKSRSANGWLATLFDCVSEKSEQRKVCLTCGVSRHHVHLITYSRHDGIKECTFPKITKFN